MSLLAQSGQPNRVCVCPLLDQSGQSRILARDGLSAMTQSGHTTYTAAGRNAIVVGTQTGRTAMKPHHIAVFSMLAGIGLGAAAVQGLHAQATPLAYVISEIDVTDKDAYAKEYVPLAVKALKESGQRQLAAGGRTAPSLVSLRKRASFCQSSKASKRRRPRIRLRLIWRLGK